MSYTIDFFKPLKGKSVEDSAEEVLESETINAYSKPQFQEIKKHVQDQFRSNGFKYEVNEQESSIEFTFPSETQILLSKNQGTLSLPYFRDYSDKEFEEAFEYLRIIRDETGFSFYDSQIGSAIDPSKRPKE